MYNIQFGDMSILLNATKSATSANGSKIDCAKECPCGVPTIPVPDQWLEVMVTGGFKVWHIIFIIIALVITLIVVYCCFHRCRIPRTKQEIEADLMRTNLATKFRDYLQEFPNEPTTFVEALKRVQELEEKALENDDSCTKKRMGWLKLKGKDKMDKDGGGQVQVDEPQAKSEANTESVALDKKLADAKAPRVEEVAAVAKKSPSKTDKQSMFAAKLKDQVELTQASTANDVSIATNEELKASSSDPKREVASSKSRPKKEETLKRKNKISGELRGEEVQGHDLHQESIVQKEQRLTKSDKSDATTEPGATGTSDSVAAADTRVARARRKRADKPGLARGKAAHHLRSRDGSNENNFTSQLEVPCVSRESKHHDRRHKHHTPSSETPRERTTTAPPQSTIIDISGEQAK